MARLKLVLQNGKRPKSSQMAKCFFGGQARKKEAKFDLFGLQEANLATLFEACDDASRFALRVEY